MIQHLPILPVVLPLAAGAMLLVVGEHHGRLKAAIAVLANLALLGCALALVGATDHQSLSIAYRVGNWPTPFGIVLVADRLAALMVLLAAILGLLNTLSALSRWSALGPYYHALSQFLLMGLCGAFLTGDLFDLFVFFEILLTASYGLVLHGSGPKRVGAGLHYIVINLFASLLFLVGVSLIFGVTGTLTMASLAERMSTLPADTRGLVHVGAAILGVAFLTKAAAWPLGFWLPRVYDAATPSAAAMLAIMTKVGVYAILRVSLLCFGDTAGVSEGFGRAWIYVAGLTTLLVGVVGMLAVRDLGRLTGYSLLVSAGILLASLVFADAGVLSGALFYMVVSTLGAAALYLLSGLIGPDEFAAPSNLEAYDEDEETAFTEDDETAVRIPAPVGVLSAAFLVCTLLIAGVPPLPGFLAKFALVAPLLQAHDGPLHAAAPVLAAMVIGSGLFALVALVRAGIQIWWAEPERVPPSIRVTEVAPVALLLLGLLMLTVLVDGPFSFIRRTAEQALQPRLYIEAVLGEGGG